jgi:stage III sporulation protein AA
MIGLPGMGKTTLLRDLIRRIGDAGTHISVVDERGELFPPEGGFDSGPATDVYTGCSKSQGILMALRTMGPQWIAVDEITEQTDVEALIGAWGCGVKLLASAHGEDVADLSRRSVYRPIRDNRIFDTVITLREDKSYRLERIPL